MQYSFPRRAKLCVSSLSCIHCMWPETCFSKAPETFRARKAIFSSSVSKNGEVHTLETSCMKRSSVHIKNMWIKLVCNLNVRDFAMLVYGSEKFPGLSRNGPQLVAKVRFLSVKIKCNFEQFYFSLAFRLSLFFCKTFDNNCSWQFVT